ncbi:MAG: hypothetical protein R2854_18675 [Caldilineaceae bacterium]
MSPSAPASISRFMAWETPLKRKCWAVINCLPDRSRAAIMRRMASGVGASGFSQMTCLPASSAAMTSSSWTIFGVHTSMMSMSGSLMMSAGSVLVRSTP